MPFQAGCTDTSPNTRSPDGRLGDQYLPCRGRLKRIDGEARVVGPGRLEVRFDTVPFLSAPYWVLWVSEDYRSAVVGVPSGRAGWILHRDPVIRPTGSPRRARCWISTATTWPPRDDAAGARSPQRSRWAQVIRKIRAET